jgi:hypothetical protein
MHDPVFPQIGEISIMKDMTKVATTMMTEEEKVEVEKELNGGGSSTPVGGSPAPLDHKPHSPTTPSPASKTTPPSTAVPPQNLTPTVHSDADVTSPSPSPSPNAKQEKEAERAKQKEAARKRAKVSQEQREKLREQDEERRKVMKERVATLTTKMMERLRPFVEAKHPGDKDDPETVAFETRMKREAEDLKLESFGVEVGSFPFCNRCMPILVTALAYHWKRVYDEGVVVHEVQEVSRHVCCLLDFFVMPFVADMYFVVPGSFRG